MTDPHRARVSVCVDRPAFDALCVEYEAAGWSTSGGAAGGAAGGVGQPRFEVRTTASGDRVDIATIAESLLRGIPVVILVEDHDAAVDTYDQCRRLAAAELFDTTHRPVTVGLDAIDVQLLLRLRDGDSVEAAARQCGVSARTAARRLARARSELSARTNGEAALRVGQRIDELAGAPGARPTLSR